MNKKYELLPKGENGLHQIRALRDFGDVKVGELGGYIERESNLNHENNAWVSGNAWVFDNARVSGDARACDTARVSGDAQVTKCLYFQQLRYSITATDTHVFIGCAGHSWAYWKANITQIGEKHKYTPDEIRQVANLLNILHLQINGKLLTEASK